MVTVTAYDLLAHDQTGSFGVYRKKSKKIIEVQFLQVLVARIAFL